MAATYGVAAMLERMMAATRRSTWSGASRDADSARHSVRVRLGGVWAWARVLRCAAAFAARATVTVGADVAVGCAASGAFGTWFLRPRATVPREPVRSPARPRPLRLLGHCPRLRPPSARSSARRCRGRVPGSRRASGTRSSWRRRSCWRWPSACWPSSSTWYEARPVAAQGSPDGWAEQSIHHPGPLAAAVACARALRQLFFTSPVPAGSNYLTMPGPIQWLGPRIGTPLRRFAWFLKETAATPPSPARRPP